MKVLLYGAKKVWWMAGWMGVWVKTVLRIAYTNNNNEILAF